MSHQYDFPIWLLCCVVLHQITMDIVEASQVSQARYHACFSIVPVDPKKGSLWTGALREILSSGDEKNENGALSLEAALESVR